MTIRSIVLILGVLIGVVSGFAGCRSPNRQFVSTEGMGGEGGATGGTAGTSGTSGSGGTCLLDEERCEGLEPQRCTETGEWVPSRASCAIACFGGRCAECVENSMTCKDGAVQTCMMGVWTTTRVCMNVCQTDTCVDACTEGIFQCNGTKLLQKCVDGDFVDDTECEVSCIDGACAGECVPDTRRCNPDAPSESQPCDARGNWGASAPCANDTFCVEGDCKPCSPEAVRCSDAGPQLCSDAGEWVNQGACSGTTPACFEGKCVTCNPGDKRCGEGVIEQCLPDGSGWDVVDTCSGDTPACLEATKTCGRCTAGQEQCLNDAVQTCDDDGVFLTTTTCSGATPQCVDAACKECDPSVGERRCSSADETQACLPDGTWAPANTCTGDTPECREDLGFDCGCDEDARRCRANSTTVPEECQGGAWVAQTACSGTLNHCLPATGQCVDCAPGSAECRNGIAYQCNSTGSFESLASCSGPGINCGNCGVGEPCNESTECRTGICVNDRCVVCQPGARDCVGSTPRVCSTDGAWVNQNICSGTTPECLPSTGQCVACLSGATRSCGNCNTGTQTCGSNNTWGSCAGAVDLNTSEQYCGSCSNSCTSSQVCEGGSCLINCGNLTRCGNSCVNLSTDPSNCLACGTRCSPPPANGSAICTASGCDISCTNTRCGSSCCAATPARATAGCSGNTCTFTCSSGNHGCGGNAPPCYSNTDATKCGSSCLDCSAYVGTTGACAGDQCTCEASSLPCGASTPTCGSWDFNSNTLEGFRIGDYRTDNAWVGGLGTMTTNGSPALMGRFDGISSGSIHGQIEVDLCSNGAILNLQPHVLSFDYYLQTTGGSRFSVDPTDGNDTFFTNGNTVILSCQPFPDVGTDTWLHGTCSALPASMTNLTIIFRIGTAWAGNIFVDNVKFVPE